MLHDCSRLDHQSHGCRVYPPRPPHCGIATRRRHGVGSGSRADRGSHGIHHGAQGVAIADRVPAQGHMQCVYVITRKGQ